MDDVKWTEGPWYSVGREVRGAGSWTVAHGFHTPDGRVEANARLIAAAPDLYAALAEMTSVLAAPVLDRDAVEPSYRKAVAALSRAREAL